LGPDLQEGFFWLRKDTSGCIANIKGHEDVESTMKKLCLQPLEQRRRARCIILLMKILAKEEQHLPMMTC